MSVEGGRDIELQGMNQVYRLLLNLLTKSWPKCHVYLPLRLLQPPLDSLIHIIRNRARRPLRLTTVVDTSAHEDGMPFASVDASEGVGATDIRGRVVANHIDVAERLGGRGSVCARTVPL